MSYYSGLIQGRIYDVSNAGKRSADHSIWLDCGGTSVRRGYALLCTVCGVSRANRISENSTCGEAGQCEGQRVREKKRRKVKWDRTGLSREGETEQLFARKTVAFVKKIE